MWVILGGHRFVKVVKSMHTIESIATAYQCLERELLGFRLGRGVCICRHGGHRLGSRTAPDNVGAGGGVWNGISFSDTVGVRVSGVGHRGGVDLSTESSSRFCG